jgi:HSP20 family protein
MIIRYNPRNESRLVRSQLFEPFFRWNFLEDSPAPAVWSPAVDVAEETDRIYVKVEIPGVDENKLTVQFEDGLLTISGEREFERKDDRNYHRIERSYGTFTRSFSLPRTVDANNIVANYRNGVLEIEIPKREESKPRQIQINTAKALES